MMTTATVPHWAEGAALPEAVVLATRGRRRRPGVAWFMFDEAAHVAALRRALVEGFWRPEPLRWFTIRDPKPRSIALSPIQDRIVHLALARAVATGWDRSLAPEDFGCRPGFGQHRALLALQRHMQRHRFAVHLDVRSYFPSVDPKCLFGILERKGVGPDLLATIGLCLAQGPALYADPAVRAAARLDADWPPAGRGLAIGSSLSQYLASHVYLNAFDHWVKRVLRVSGYVRYVDDIFLFGDRRADLRTWRAEVGAWLWNQRGLRLKHPDARVLNCAGTLDGLGYRLTRTERTPHGRTLDRMHARIRTAWVDRSTETVDASLAATVGIWMF